MQHQFLSFFLSFFLSSFWGFPVFVDWKKVTHAWIEKTFKRGVKLSYSEENYGLVISGDTTSHGCGSGIDPGALTLIKGYWTKVKYTQEFRGSASCWSIFGAKW